MIVKCENCGSSFNLKDSLVKPNGRKVRCSKCKKVFFVPPPAEGPDDSDALDLTMEEVDVSTSSSEADTPHASSEEIQFSLDDDKAEDTPENPDDSSFSELENMLSADEPVSSETTSIEKSTDDLEFELDLPDTPERPESSSPKDDDLDDLELELDLDDFDESESSPSGSETKDDGDFDLSDIDALLEIDDNDQTSSSEKDEADSLELELDLDTGIMNDAQSKDPQEKSNSRQPQDDFDFSKIEAMLELDDEIQEKDKAATPDAEKEFQLDFELDSDLSEPETNKNDDDIDLDFDIEIEEDEDSTQASHQFGKENDDSIENIIQANIDTPGKSTEAEGFSTGGQASGSAMNASDDVDKVNSKNSKSSGTEKKKLLKSVMACAVLLLVAGGGYFAFNGVVSGTIEIPFINDQLNAASDSTNEDAVIPLNDSIAYDFVNNTKVGNLLVITGEVQNTSKASQRFVKVSGTLITKGGNKTNITKTVYCGNMFSDIELTNADISEVNKRLIKNPSGDNHSNTRIEPGGKIPFMIVFSNLPENLETFEIKVADYLPAEG